MTEQLEDRVLVPNPPKLWKNFFTWLQANTFQDKHDLRLNTILLDEENIFWATNGYALVRAELDAEEGYFLKPGVWAIEKSTAQLLHISKNCVGYPGVHTIWDKNLILDQRATPIFDPKIFTDIAKPFAKVLLHAQRPGYPMQLVLEDPKDMPEGIYSAILMPMNIKDGIRQEFVKAKFNVEYLMPESFDFYSDPGHGWLEVPMAAIKYLDIADRISECSYVNFSNVYLEEDEDMSTFFTAYRGHYGKEPVIVQKFDDEQRIRGYRHYSKR